MIPVEVRGIIEKLNSAGFEGYAVGGCVRDMLIGRTPKDWDITTNAAPEQVKALFKRTIDTGIEHGTVTVMIGREGFEVTTYRVDGDYLDGRHPESVTFTSSLEEDLKRRDFTINAMACDLSGEIVDLFGGRDDLENGIVKCVGDPLERFSEDALRMMRAIRFSAELGFTIEEKTYEAIKTLAPTIEKISAERIRDELVKTIVSDNPGAMRLFYDTGLTSYFLPEFDKMMEQEQKTPHHMYTVGEHTVKVMEGVKRDEVLRIAALLHDVAKPDCFTIDEAGIAHFKGHPKKGAVLAKDILKRLKFDNALIKSVTALVEWHDYRPEPDEKSIRRAINKVGLEQFPNLFDLKYADIYAQSDYYRQAKLDKLDGFKKLYFEIMEREECVSLKTLAVSGNDLMQAGIKPGPQMGELLNALLSDVLDEPLHNNNEYLIALAKRISFGEGA
ncbi:MAG: CCA tRNA nucleotidyltransferase [Lachnospiraceae bacterium]|nr:CCA tRNA nucleotidyltransferase [Lachnospiraceae bacterium]